MGSPWGPWGTHGAHGEPMGAPGRRGSALRRGPQLCFFLIDSFRVPSICLQISKNLAKFSRAAAVVRTNRFPPLKTLKRSVWKNGNHPKMFKNGNFPLEHSAHTNFLFLKIDFSGADPAATAKDPPRIPWGPMGLMGRQWGLRGPRA